MEYKFGFEKTSNNIIMKVKNVDKEFDPLTIFEDFLENAYAYKMAGADANVIKKFFLNIFGIMDENEITKEYIADYFDLICALQTRIDSKILSTVDELEKLRSFYGLTFTFKFVIIDYDKVKNIDKIEYINTSENRIDIIKNEVDTSEGSTGIVKPLLSNFSEVTTPSKENIKNDHYCIYECFSIRDAVFSILHYLFLNEYELMKCEHCGKYFARKKSKNAGKRKYCPRFSPHKKYTGETCAVAVNKIRSKIRSRKNNIYKYINSYYPNAAVPFCDEFAALFKKASSIEELELLEYITSEKYVKEKWYREEYKQTQV